MNLKSMFASGVSGRQGCSSKTNHTADGHDAPSASLCHVRQHLLSQRDGTKEIELHQSLVHIDTGLQAEGALGSATIVDENVDLRAQEKAAF